MQHIYALNVVLKPMQNLEFSSKVATNVCSAPLDSWPLAYCVVLYFVLLGVFMLIAVEELLTTSTKSISHLIFHNDLINILDRK